LSNAKQDPTSSLDRAGQYGRPPPGEHRLDRELVARVPRDPGTYAAWIIDSAALVEAGIAGTPPVLVYVGVANGSGGLRARLRDHASAPWWELLDLLASRKTVLPGWWSYANKNVGRTSLTVPPLANVAEQQALAWQHCHLRWGWITNPSVSASTLECAWIERYLPMLNLKGRGYKALGPVQLRNGIGYERERAWWLFHVSWIAVITLQPPGWVDDCWTPGEWWGADRVSCDDDGWPVRIGDGETHTIRIPSERSARELLLAAAPPTLRDEAADSSTTSEEATAWWAAYAGHAFLQDSQPHSDALRAGLARSADGYRAPISLPTGPKRADLLELIRPLPGVGH
jgi:hypothetical protein